MTRFIVFSLLLIAFLSTFVKADVKPVESTIRWQTFHVPPVFMKVGDMQGQGFIDQILAQIIQKLPEYEHEKPFTTHARALLDIEQGKNACHPALFKTPEREVFAVFSVPAFFTPSNRLVTIPSIIEQHSLQQQVDLGSLLNNRDIALALVEGRSYGPAIDGELTENEGQNIYRMPIEKIETLLLLISKQRVDGTIAFPFEVSYFNKVQQPEQKLTVLPLKHVEEYAIGHVACPNNAWGKRVIEKVNLALSELLPTKAYKLGMTRWWEEERVKPGFKRYYQKHLLEHLQHLDSAD